MEVRLEDRAAQYVSSSGTVSKTSIALINFTCTINLHEFPFDKQRCELLLNFRQGATFNIGQFQLSLRFFSFVGVIFGRGFGCETWQETCWGLFLLNFDFTAFFDELTDFLAHFF